MIKQLHNLIWFFSIIPYSICYCNIGKFVPCHNKGCCSRLLSTIHPWLFGFNGNLYACMGKYNSFSSLWNCSVWSYALLQLVGKIIQVSYLEGNFLSVHADSIICFSCQIQGESTSNVGGKCYEFQLSILTCSISKYCFK